MKKIVILFSGEGTNLEYILKNEHNFEVVQTLTNNKISKGITISKNYNKPCHILSKNDFEEELINICLSVKPDIIVLAGFMKILSSNFIKKFNIINLHPSLLPLHKGLNAIERSYYDKSIYGGVTVHYVVPKIDSGEIILSNKILKESLSLEEYIFEIKIIEKQTLLDSINLLI